MPRWALLLLLLAALKVTGGIAAFIVINPGVNPAPGTPIPPAAFFINVLVFGSAAAVLLVGGRRDRRAEYLGASFLVSASSFSNLLLDDLSTVISEPAVQVLDGLHADAFSPYFFWLFASDFPRGLSFGRDAAIARVALRLSVGAGCWLFVINAILVVEYFAPNSIPFVPFLSLFQRSPAGFYWATIFGLQIPALLFMVWRTKMAGPDERRRVQLFVSAIVVGTAPLMLQVLLEAVSPAFHDFMNVRSTRLLDAVILYILLHAIPVVTAYSVLVHRVLDVQLIIRKALQYALARYTVLVVGTIPFVLIVVYVYLHRNEPVHTLFSGTAPFWLLGAATTGVAALRLRQPLFKVLDRHFFREQHDSSQILASLVGKSHLAGSVENLSAVLTVEIDRALHLDSIAVLVSDQSRSQFVAPDRRTRPLPSGCRLAGLLSENPGPLEVDLENPASPLQRLPLEDREWLADGAVRLLVPLTASKGALLGIIGMGAKKSELPFSREDQQLLVAIAASGALTLENRLIRGMDADGHTLDEPAAECHLCGTLHPPRTSSCRWCDQPLEPAPVPYLLNGKFQLEQRIGRGGMGVVYRALDLDLGRAVAIKTLPKVSPEYAMRLRREARAMARLWHPNLALIFGAETWRGTPMLIFEFLPGGTLADRLKQGPIPMRIAVSLALALSEALERMHATGILHCDIKPSNIGFNAQDVPKVMDFGLAHILDDARKESFGGNSHQPTSTMTTLPRLSMVKNQSRGVAGTPLYLSPEAAKGQLPDTSFDLWSLVIVLYESIAGKHPMASATVPEIFSNLSEAAFPDIRNLVPDCPEPLALFFQTALARSQSQRPATAAELRSRLESLQVQLSPQGAS